jgi:hypothetical protein
MTLRHLAQWLSRRCQKRIRSEAKRHRDEFTSLVSLDPGVKRRITRSVRHSSNALAAFDVWKNNVEMTTLYGGALLGSISLFFGAPYLVHRWFHIHYSALGWVGVFFLYDFVVLLEAAIFSPFGAIAIWLRHRPRRQVVRVLPATPQLLWISVVIAGYLVFVYRVFMVHKTGPPPNVFVYVLVSGIIGMIAYTAILALWLPPGFLLGYAMEKRKRVVFPDAFVVAQLVSILSSIERKPKQWTGLDFKRHLMSELEQVARCIERDLTRRLRTSDTTTDAWLRDRARHMAAALRGLKKWISTPMSDTRDHLIQELSQNLICAASGDWDGFSSAEPDKLTGSQFRSRVFSIARTLLAGAVPGLALWGLQSMPTYRLEGEIYHYVLIAVSTWALISVLSTFDQDFGAKTSALAEIAKTFIPGKK